MITRSWKTPRPQAGDSERVAFGRGVDAAKRRAENPTAVWLGVSFLYFPGTRAKEKDTSITCMLSGLIVSPLFVPFPVRRLFVSPFSAFLLFVQLREGPRRPGSRGWLDPFFFFFASEAAARL